MADGGDAGQSFQDLLAEDLRDETHLRVDMQPFAVAGRDAGRFLTAVLEGVKAEIGEPRYVFIRRINTEHAALFAQTRAQRMSSQLLGTARYRV